MNIIQAYFDINCSESVPMEEAMRKRDLNFRDSNLLDRETAKEMMAKALGGGNYNNFTPSIFDLFPANAQFQLAREGSVALYVKGGKLPSARKVCADEKDKFGEFTRYWWD